MTAEITRTACKVAGDLVEGVVINRNLYSGTGLLLLPKGTVLDRPKIVSIQRYYDIDPPKTGFFVVKGLHGE